MPMEVGIFFWFYSMNSIYERKWSTIYSVAKRKIKKDEKSWKKVLTKGVIECIIIKSSVERAKEHEEEKCSGWEKVKNFFKKLLKKSWQTENDVIE